jgi:parallel beta-helix repeat protein
VGGTAAGAGNVISGNGFSGIRIEGAGTWGNVVQGNRIGLAASTGAAIGNTASGIIVTNSASITTIGGTNPGAGNTIAHNSGHGITLVSGSSNSVLGNRVFKNGGLGIDLVGNGVTANDLHDADMGANNLQNTPNLSTVNLIGQNLTITGSINTEQNKTIRIEFFASPEADGSGFGEGRKYLGFATVVMGTNNTMSFNTTLAVAGLQPGWVVSATATDHLGNTSEFSLAVLVT